MIREVCLCYSMELRRKLEEERQVKERNLKLMEELERLADENVCINIRGISSVKLSSNAPALFIIERHGAVFEVLSNWN